MRCPFCESQLEAGVTRCHCSYQVRLAASGSRNFREPEETQREDEPMPGLGAKAEMEKDLKGWGLGLIGLGAVSIVWSFFSGPLDPVWGGLMIPLGVLSLVIPRRGMFIVIGIALSLAGLLNLASGLTGNFGGDGGGFHFPWIGFGIAQIWWGVKEIRKFAWYAPRNGTGMSP